MLRDLCVVRGGMLNVENADHFEGMLSIAADFQVPSRRIRRVGIEYRFT